MTIPAKREWFAFAMTDAAIAHATLALVSLDRDLTLGIATSAVTLHHRTAAMHHAQDLIRKDSQDKLYVLAGTVAILTSGEVSATLV